MSQENVEVVRQMLSTTGEGDLDAAFAAYDPQVVWRTGKLDVTGMGLDPVYVGHEGVRAFWREWLKAWETISFEWEEFIDAGDRVIVVLSQRMRGRTSGAEVDMPSYATMFTVREGKVFEVEFFRTRDEALEAVGLRE